VAAEFVHTYSQVQGGIVDTSRKLNVDPGIAHSIGTLALWVGWIALLRGVYLGVRLAFEGAGRDSAAGLRAIGLAAGISALGFLIANGLLLPPKTQEGFRLPITWLMMPFTAWMAVLGFCFGSVRVAQGIFALNPEERRDKLSAAVLWTVFGGLFLFLFLRSEDEISILRGEIPFQANAAIAFLLLAVAAIAAVAAVQRRSRARGIAKAAANHLALFAGSIVFGLPFVWALITSFKEDKDMSSPSGIVWVPRVQKKVPYFDPDDVRVAGKYQGQDVEGSVLEKFPDGSAKIDILKPAVLRGLTFMAPAPLNVVPKEIDVVSAPYEGRTVTGMVIKDMPNGGKRIEVLEPKELKGRTFEAELSDVEFVRPVGLRWQNYPEALDMLPVETSRGLVFLKNTLIIVILNVIGTLISSSIVAYAFARLRFPGKGALFLVLLSTMMLPAAVTLIPTFLIFRWLGWIDTLKPLWVPAFLGSAFNIFLLRQFFMSIPAELEDAAKIDGCTYLRTFWQVMLPQIKPALAVIAIWTFMAAWNNFMGPLIYINSPENMPISYAVQLFQSDRSGEPGLLMAFATMAMLPVLAVFFVAQKYFIEGVTLSGLGGR